MAIVRTAANDSLKLVGAVASATPAWNQATVLGSFLVMIVCHYAQQSGTASITTPTGWTLAGTVSDPSDSVLMGVYYRENSAVRSGNDSAVAWTPSTAGWIYLGEYPGAKTASAPDGTLATDAGGTSATPPVTAGSVTPTQSADVAIGAIGKRNSTETMTLDSPNSTGTWTTIATPVSTNASASANVAGVVAECFPRGRALVEMDGTWAPTSQGRPFSGVCLLVKAPDGQRVVFQSMGGSVTPSGAAVKREVKRTVTGSTTPTGVNVRGLVRTMAGSITPTGALAMLKAKLFGGSITPSGVVVLTLAKLLTGAVAPVGTLVRALARLLAGSTTPVGTVKKSLSRSLAGATSPVGTVARAVARAVAGSLTLQGALGVMVTWKRSMTGATTPTGAVTQRTVSRPAAGSVTPTSGVLRKVVLRPITGAVAPVGTVVRLASKLLVGAVTPLGNVLRRLALVAFVGATTPVGAIQKAVAKLLVGGVLNVNYITNPGAEVDVSGWTAYSAGSTGTDLVRDTGQQVVGAASFKATAKAASITLGMTTTNVIKFGVGGVPMPQVGQQYTFSAWLKATAGWSNKSVRLLVRQSGGAQAFTDSTVIPTLTSASWQRVVNTFTIDQPDRTTVDVFIIHNSVPIASEGFYADEIRMTPLAYLDTGTLARRVGRTIAGAIAPTSVLGTAVVRVVQLAMSGFVEPGGTVTKLAGKRPSGSVAPSGTVKRTAGKLLAGATAPTGVLKRALTKTLAGALTPLGALRRGVQLVLRGSTTPSGSLQATGVDTGPGLEGAFDEVPPDELSDETFDTREPEAVP